MMTVRWLREQMRLGKSIYDLPLRVTFYARVSTEKVEQQGSLENQIQYYTEFIQKNPNWTYIPGYIDEGISGTSTYKRDSFLRMIILTKDGQHFHSEIDLHDEVNDYNSIRSIIPCQGVSAVYLDDDGDSEICPCAFVMLMSDGKIEPFVFATDKDIERIANKGHTGFTGFVPTK